MLMGKGLFDEQQPGFVGTYSGIASAPQTREAIENADTIICVGTRFTDTITAGFTQHLPLERTIEIQPFAVRVGDHWFSRIPMDQALRELMILSASLSAEWRLPDCSAPEVESMAGGSLTQSSFWSTVQEQLRPGDIILADQGTAAFADEDRGEYSPAAKTTGGGNHQRRQLHQRNQQKVAGRQGLA